MDTGDMNTIHSALDSRPSPNRRTRWGSAASPPRAVSGAEAPAEAVTIDLGHLTGADLEVTLETAAWVVSRCESRAGRPQPVGAVRFDLGADRPGWLLGLDG